MSCNLGPVPSASSYASPAGVGCQPVNFHHGLLTHPTGCRCVSQGLQNRFLQRLTHEPDEFAFYLPASPPLTQIQGLATV